MAGKFVIVDTSSIIFGLSKKHDVFSALEERFPGYSLLISQGIMNEIKGIAGGNGRYAKYAKAALEIINRNKRIEISRSIAYPDSWILASSPKAEAVCTNDIALKRELRRKGAAVLSMAINGKLR
jgi:rRNA-processing protein FCF1